MDNFKVYTTFNKSWGQTAPSARKCLKTQFWGPPTNWKFEPCPKAHTHSDLIINKHTEQVKKPRMDLSWHALNSTLQAKTLYHTEKQGLGYLWPKNPDTPTKTRWSRAQFQKGQPTPCKTMYAFPAHLWVREFWPQIYSLWRALDWGLLSNILASTKMGRA